jgi:ABC-2 type transport system ATP-binding protein
VLVSTPLRLAGDPVIEVRDLRMSYGPKVVLDGVDFVVRPGEVVALLGPNGAGKSTTIEILEGFRMRSAGEVSVLGADPAQADETWRSRIGVVLQSWRDHGRWQVRELLEHLGAYYRPYSTDTRSRPVPAAELLAMVGLTDLAGQRIATLSGGQRRRLDVAIGIVGRPDVLFLDEPTVGFDPQARHEFHDVVHRLSDFEATTIILTTHDLAEAEKLADRILILAGSTIVADGSADELSRQVAGRTEVKWSVGGERFVHSAEDGTAFVRDLFAEHGDRLADLEVRRATLEDTYLAMVRRYEGSPAGGPEQQPERAEQVRAGFGGAA